MYKNIINIFARTYYININIDEGVQGRGAPNSFLCIGWRSLGIARGARFVGSARAACAAGAAGKAFAACAADSSRTAGAARGVCAAYIADSSHAAGPARAAGIGAVDAARAKEVTSIAGAAAPSIACGALC